MAVKPISPTEVTAQKRTSIPDFVIECWNNAIAKKWTGNGCVVTIKQDDIENEIAAKLPPGVKRSDIYSNGWLDIEPIYRARGWKVIFDKPGYCESYDAYFQFSKK